MRKYLVLLLMAVGLVKPSSAQRTANIALIHHNIASGGQPRAAADHIEELMELTPNKALILLNEANYARQYFTLPHAEWHHIWPSSPHEGRGNAIFVRDAAATLVSSWVLTMNQEWTHNQPKDPRVYPAVKCELVSNPWVQFHCIAVHFPTARTGNGPARQESIDRLIEASTSMPLLPLIICGDFNMNDTEARQRIATPIGARLFSNASVDHIIIRDGQSVGFGENITVTRLGQMGSDHQALRYSISFVEKTSLVSDWMIY